MARFEDLDLLTNRSFGYALSAYDPDREIEDDTPTISSRLALYIDEDNVANVDSKFYFYKERDPVDAPVVAKYSKGNKFISGLEAAVGVPVGTIIIYPTYDPRRASTKSYFGLNTLYEGSKSYPGGIPENFVPCCGQLLRYPNGEVWQVPFLGRPAMIGSSQPSRFSYQPTTPTAVPVPGVIFLQKVPPGWKEDKDPLLQRRSKKLEDLAGFNVGLAELIGN
jgi:hypothetical protein